MFLKTLSMMFLTKRTLFAIETHFDGRIFY